MIKRLVLFMLLFQTISAFAQLKIVKNIAYTNMAQTQNTLNVFYKNDGIKNKPVLIFIHGGSWSSGKKETYWWLGRNFARKGIVTVVINYPLAPNVQYGKMADDCALAVKWVHEYIADYTGSAEKIFAMGHSAGAHLAELINADTQYFKHAGIKNPLRGIILNDAFGLDMEEYLISAKRDHYYDDFLRTFTNQSATWKLGSPLNYVENIKNPHLIFYGGKTYGAIKVQSLRLYETLVKNHIAVDIKEIKNKKHVPMISQMIFGRNALYQDIVQFIMKNTN